MVTVVVKEYQHRIPDSKEKFNCDLQNWYGERGIAPLTPSVAGHDWDHYTIFKLVADKGGAEATTQRKAWRSVAQKWHPEVAKRSNIGSIMKHNYEKTLGAFETWLTAGVPTLVKHFKALAPGPVAGAAAAAWAAAAGPAGSRPGVALPPTGQQRRALLMREQTGVASSGAAGSTSIGSTSHQGEYVFVAVQEQPAQQLSLRKQVVSAASVVLADLVCTWWCSGAWHVAVGHAHHSSSHVPCTKEAQECCPRCS
jgi:hypothetical protein